MHPEIDRLYLSGISDQAGDIDFEDFNTDVIVVLNNGQKYMAAFFTLRNIEQIHLQYRESGENLSGKYFWAKNLVLVDNCRPASIRSVVEDLIEEGNFKNVFERIF